MSAKRILLLYLLMNIFNYVDRQVVTGVAPLIKDHFQISDALVGLLGTAFMISYSITAIPFGAWSDRWLPQKVAAIGVGFWSLATVSSALAWSFGSLFFFRSLVGVGEAAYVSTAGTILSNSYPASKRSAVLGLFNLGMPIGGAAGVVLGGIIGTHFGWQWTFFLVGIPGLLLAYSSWRLKLQNQPLQPEAERPKFQWSEVAALLRNKPYIWTCLGYAGISFGFGAIVFWAPTFFQRSFGFSLEQASLYTGALQVAAGLLGAPIGGYVADWWQKRHRSGRALTMIVAMLACAAFLWAGLVFSSFICFFFATFFLLWHVGVASAIVFDVTKQHLWNTASATAMFLMHFLGDIWSPTIVGSISDATSLTTAFSLLPISLLLASFFFYMTSRTLKQQAQVSA